MVVINNFVHAQRQTAKGKKTFVSVLAVVLALILMVSTIAFAIPTISALQCPCFTHQEKIFIDLTGFTGWEDASAKIRVYTYYGDSDDDWNVENNKKDSECNNNACYQKAITPAEVTDHVYSFNINGDKVGYVKVMRLNPDMTTQWDSTGFAYHKDRTGSANCIKITGWSNSFNWTTYSASGDNYQEVTAQPDAASITNNSKLYTIDATFYDYFTDNEVQNGWGNINYVESHGDWEPYQTLNSKIASASSGVKYPMYFGNFFDKNDGYTGEGSSNMVNFSNWVNNSARLGDTHYSVVGLTGTNLVDGDLMYATTTGGTSTVKVPFFDKSFLQSNGVGAVVNTKFPMRKVTSNGITTYTFDSSSSASNGGDNAWFSADHKTMYYGEGTTNGAKDALSYYSNPQTASGYGFFPFDSQRGTDKEALDFGFGMRVDVSFNLGGDENHYGQIKGTNGSYVDQVFSFTGDDDVWVYIDGNLVLDLGGDHQKASGSINFANGKGKGKVTVSTGSNTLNNATRNTDFSIINYDPTEEHTLTMFYVERGMVESNLSFNFNFAPLSNELIVDKTVNTTNINEGLKTAVAAADTFSFKQPTANGKASTKGTISNSTYTLKNGESISFKDQFDVGTSITVTESESSPLDYTTSWKAVDLEYQKKGAAASQYTLGSGNSTTANFTYQTKDTSSEFNMTRVQLSYVNTPSTGNVAIAKRLEGGGSEEFSATVTVSLDGGTTYKAYPLQYTVSDKSGTYTLSASGTLNANAKLKNNRTLTFSNLPRGAKVKVVENITQAQSAGYKYNSINGAESTVSGGGVATVASGTKTMTISNGLKSGGAQLELQKTLGGKLYSGAMFSFSLTGLPSMTIGGKTTVATDDYFDWINEIEDGQVIFDLDNLTVGTFCYMIEEDDINTGNARVDGEITVNPNKQFYLAKVEMKEVSGALSPTITYYNYDGGLDVTAADFSASNMVRTEVPVFENRITTPYIQINKKDQNNTTVTGTAKFAVYKVSGDGADISTGTLVEEKSTVNGTVRFGNLDLYQESYESARNPGNLKYQWYAVVETQAPNGHNPSTQPIYVQFPIRGQNNEWVYRAVYDYQNGKIVNPQTAGMGNGIFKTVGWSIAGISVCMLAAYVLLSNKSKKRAKHIIKK